MKTKGSRWLVLPLICGFVLLACRPITAPDEVQISPDSTPVRGATVPWIEYEAEAGQTNATVLTASRTFGKIAAESSGRQSVELNETGHFVQFTTIEDANSLVLRYVIPDAPAGGGITATLSLYVNDIFRQKLNLTSRYAWSYGGETRTLNQPGAGGAHHFFDEVRTLLDPIPTGARVMLKKDEDDSADYYVVDLIDLEQVAPPKEMPADFLSITECGATADDGSDDARAIRDCIFQSRLQGKGVWIPTGTFDVNTMTGDVRGFSVADVTIHGAGMWYSTLHGEFARFYCTGDNCRFADFAILGETTERNDETPDNGFSGAAGSGSRMENVWVEHTKVGWWVGQGNENVTDGLVITGSRFRNLFADGVNFCNGTSNSLVEQSHFRNTGDDALASWAPSFDGGVNTNNVFRFNTVQIPWRANCFAIYGGKDNRIEDNLCADVVTYPGILIAQQFNAWQFEGITTVARNSLIRAGGPMWNQQHGALKIHAAEGSLSGVVVEDLLIDSPTFSGIQIESPNKISSVSFKNIEILNAGTDGILISPNANGSASFDAISVIDATQKGMRVSGSRFTIERGADNHGW